MSIFKSLQLKRRHMLEYIHLNSIQLIQSKYGLGPRWFICAGAQIRQFVHYMISTKFVFHIIYLFWDVFMVSLYIIR